eukprot:TRINITY_DN11439_c0_g1_i1.p1 TRINITY_DN11439_c0_g1~~TRINITY_DN11439_c0_g1_i1.p1  ORF type:complete len:286 (+),score=53.79 TRINITY_DN11439_c0_g1_i1:34-891(+)
MRFFKPIWFDRSYVVDWLVCISLLIVVLSVTQVANIPPHVRYLPSGFQDAQFPFQNETMPLWLLLVGCLVVPVFMFAAFQIALRSLHDFHHAILGLLEAVTFSTFFTMFIQLINGAYTPDWYARERTGDLELVRQGRFSFPDSYASLSFATMSYLALYLCGKLGPYRQDGGQAWKMIIVLTPIAIAALISSTRTLDYRAHFVDSVAGSAIGVGAAICAYFLNFPGLGSDVCDEPKRRSHGSSRSRGWGDDDRVGAMPILNADNHYNNDDEDRDGDDQDEDNNMDS